MRRTWRDEKRKIRPGKPEGGQFAVKRVLLRKLSLSNPLSNHATAFIQVVEPFGTYGALSKPTEAPLIFTILTPLLVPAGP